MNLQPQPINLSDLLRMIEEGTLQLPEFQRLPTWKKTDDEQLLRTVARGWPCGVLLAMRGTSNLKYRQLADTPASKKSPEMLLLDGQQRMTALYRAFKSRGGRAFYVKLGEVVKDGSFSDSHLMSDSVAKFTKSYGDLSRSGRARVAMISTLVDDNAWDQWLGYLPDQTERSKYISARTDLLSGFKGYTLYVSVLPENTDLAVVARIFETINKTGVRLEVFDLVVAKVYSSSFNLRERWEDSARKYSMFEEFRMTGLDILKLIALSEATAPGGRGGGVTGVRQDDVLRLDAATIVSRWSLTAKTLAQALTWLKTNCGVRSAAFLPIATMVLPLAQLLSEKRTFRAQFEADLKRWFWASSIEQTYAQGANTRAVSDVRELRAWNNSAAATPHAVVSATKLNATDISGRLLKPRARNEMLARASFCCILARGGVDWVDKKNLLSHKTDLDIHHILATGQKLRRGASKEERIANLTPLSKATNQSLSDDPPSTVKAVANRSAVETHGVNWELFEDGAKPDEHDRFLQDRSETLGRWLVELVKES